MVEIPQGSTSSLFVPFSSERLPNPELGIGQRELLDVFNLVDPDTFTTQTVAVVACSGDHIDAITVNEANPLVARQIAAHRVSKRDKFRHIAADQVDLFRMTGLTQDIDHDGLNDPVTLHTVRTARVSLVAGELRVQRYNEVGSLTSGRLDILQAFELSEDDQTTFGQQGREISQLTLPTEPTSTIQRGRGLGLVYPMISTDSVGIIGNEGIRLRIAYDLLSTLQSEIRDMHPQHPLAHETLPVPSREAYVQQLRAAGYEIHGSEGVMRVSSGGIGGNVLGKLQRLFFEFDADKVVVPPQATVQDYIEVIKRIRNDFATSADLVALNAVRERITASAPIQKPQRTTTTPKIETAKVPFKPQKKRKSKKGPITPEPKTKKSYASDFVTNKPTITSGWSGDFEPKKTKTTNVTDWASDFESH